MIGNSYVFPPDRSQGNSRGGGSPLNRWENQGFKTEKFKQLVIISDYDRLIPSIWLSPTEMGLYLLLIANSTMIADATRALHPFPDNLAVIGIHEYET